MNVVEAVWLNYESIGIFTISLSIPDASLSRWLFENHSNGYLFYFFFDNLSGKYGKYNHRLHILVRSYLLSSL